MIARDMSETAPPFQSVGFTLSRTGYAVSSGFSEVLAPLGLEPRDFALLRSVAASEGDTQQAVGKRLGIQPSRMVAFVDSLESRGLIERRANPRDRRARALYLTDAGSELLGSAFEAAVKYERELCAELSEDERGQLLALLQRVAEGLGLAHGVHAALAEESPRGAQMRP